jgi:hypothetical protein
MPRWDDAARARQSELIRSWEPLAALDGANLDARQKAIEQNAQLTGMRAELRLMVREVAAAVQSIKKLRRQGLLK